MTAHAITSRINGLYDAFNRRESSFVIDQMSTSVTWPRAFEGGFAKGREAVRAYWEQQWSEIDPTVTPVSITQLNSTTVDVEVHQVVRDLDGNLLADVMVHHFYEFDENDLIASMTIDIPTLDLHDH